MKNWIAGLLLAATLRVSQPLPLPLPVANGGSGNATGSVTTVALSAPTITSTSTTCGIGTLTNSNTYYFKVTASNAAGETTGSNEVSRATGNCISVPNSSGITVNWSPVTGATSYTVYIGASGAETAIAASVGNTQTTYTAVTTGEGVVNLPTRNSTADEVHVGGISATSATVSGHCTLGTDCANIATTGNNCVCSDVTSAAACKATTPSGGTFTITGNGTDVVAYLCL